MLWEAEPLAETERRLAALGVRSVVFAPGGNAPAAGDWLELMDETGTRLATALAERR